MLLPPNFLREEASATEVSFLDFFKEGCWQEASAQYIPFRGGFCSLIFKIEGASATQFFS